jgi:hypothetical protein
VLFSIAKEENIAMEYADMKTIILALPLFVGFAVSANAQCRNPFRPPRATEAGAPIPCEGMKHNLIWRVAHYVGTHKELLVSDAIMLMAANADAASTVHNRHRGLIETNPILGRQPDNVQLYAFANATPTLLISINHFAWHRYQQPWNPKQPTDPDRHWIWFDVAAYTFWEQVTIRHNISVAEKK